MRRSTCARHVLGAALLALITVTWIRTARADGAAASPSDAPSPAPDPETRSTPALWVPGLVTFGAAYIAGFVVYFRAMYAADGCETTTFPATGVCARKHADAKEGGAPLVLPLVGPFIAAHTWDEYGTSSLLLLGTAQILGAGAVIAGAAWRHPAPPKADGSPSAALMPVVGLGHAGVAIHGHF
jgi:hypothetical protein